jgi:hypothetical protein
VKAFETDPKPINKHKIVLAVIENAIPEMVLFDNLVILEQIDEEGLAGGGVAQHDEGVFVLQGFEHVKVVGEEEFGREQFLLCEQFLYLVHGVLIVGAGL